MISFSADNNGLPDSSGEYTGASLTKPDMPRDFTICAAYMVQAWTTAYSAANLFNLYNGFGSWWGDVNLFAGRNYTQVEVNLGKVSVIAQSDHLLFPLTWSSVCVSLDSLTGMVQIIYNGNILKERVYQEAMDLDVWRPDDLDIVVGYSVIGEDTGMLSQLNIFSSPLSTARMVALTQAGGEECGAPGDYVSWEEAQWKLTSHAKMEVVGELEGPCRRESQVNVFTPPAGYLWSHIDCMEHCQKLGRGRSPPVRTLEEWDWMKKEVHAITPDISHLPYLWLAATDEEVEGEWSDAYTGEELDTGVAWPWYVRNKDQDYADDSNCIQWYTDQPDDESWNEWQCNGYDMGCPCQYTQQPVLLLRGLCQYSSLKPMDITQYTPKQLPGSANNVFLVGKVSTQIHYNNSSEQWVMTDAVSSVRAQSRATKLSYALGKHKWTVTGDVFACNEGKPYTTLLKLSGCNSQGEFTCNNGQCVNMEQRCNQVPNCLDKSDERGCHLVVTEEGYSKVVPPTTLNSSDNSIIPVHVNISINLLKIIDMEEQDHKIDLQFQITLEWRENDRVVFHNLKQEKSLNALSAEEIHMLWLPKVFYDNTDMKEVTRGGMGWEWPTVVTIWREGSHDSCETNPSCRRSGVEEVEEIEIFKGGGNSIEMQQVYTVQFQCKYDLQ